MNAAIEKFIVGGYFLEAKKALDQLNLINILHDILLKIAYNNESICAYAFICFLLSKNNDLEYHKLALTILDCGISYLPGAYHASYYHHIKAIELDPKNVNLYAELLFFYDVPEKVINYTEARLIAQNIITKLPNNKKALEILNTPTDESFNEPLETDTSFEEFILNGRINYAKKIAASHSIEEVSSLIYEIAIYEQNICLYAFIWSELQETEVPEYHQLAANILNSTYKKINGYADASAFHVRMAKQLNLEKRLT